MPASMHLADKCSPELPRIAARNSIRVLHIVAGNLYGGVERLLATLASNRHLCPAMKPSFALCYTGRLSRELQEYGADVFMLGKMRTRNPVSVLRARARLNELCRKLRPDAVVFHSLWPYVLLGIGNKRTHCLNTLWLHGHVDKIGMLERAARLQEPDLTIANSRFTAGSTARLFRDIKAEVIYCPVSINTSARQPALRTAIRQQLGASDNDVVIVQVSRLEEWKGQRSHLVALSKLRNLANWVCWIVGGAQRPRERAYLEQLRFDALSLGVADRVRFLDEREDVPTLLLAADIYCQPNSGPEPFGITFVEAMGASLPVIGTRLGATPELIDNSCGVLCQPGNTEELADCLHQLISRPNLRLLLGQGGPSRALALSEPRARLHEIYSVLADRRNTRALTIYSDKSAKEFRRPEPCS